MQPPPGNNRSTPAQFRTKLGHYLSGVAIGFMLLGLIYFFKHQATVRDRERAQQEREMSPGLAGEPTAETGTTP